MIVSVDRGRQLELRGDIPRGLTGYDGCTFTAKLTGPGLEAAVDVYDINPERWTKLFRALAQDWRGWRGERSLESLEGHLRLACTADRTGHITFGVRLRHMVIGDDWRVDAELHVEAGQLDGLADEAAAYFG